MRRDYRFVKNETAYLPGAEAALRDRFASSEAFRAFYESLVSPERKNQFLRAATFYYYMVKQGDWVVSAPDSNPVIDYFTNSYKTVGLFAIIESLSDEEHQDFHGWLTDKSGPCRFPIQSQKDLNALHSQYKETYGSIRRCVAFFGRLPAERQEELCKAVEVDRKPLASIKKLAEFLYNIRSKFVHQADLVLQMAGPIRHFGHAKPLYTRLTMSIFLAAFEEGLVAYFSET